MMTHYVFVEAAEQILTQSPQAWGRKVLLLCPDMMTASLVQMMTIMKAVAIPK